MKVNPTSYSYSLLTWPVEISGGQSEAAGMWGLAGAPDRKGKVGCPQACNPALIKISSSHVSGMPLEEGSSTHEVYESYWRLSNASEGRNKYQPALTGYTGRCAGQNWKVQGKLALTKPTHPNWATAASWRMPWWPCAVMEASRHCLLQCLCIGRVREGWREDRHFAFHCGQAPMGYHSRVKPNYLLISFISFPRKKSH